jgi:vitamin-K-epoxide reductase (warfarin-sensitive)
MWPAMNVKSRRIFALISLLAIGGVVISSISLYHHYGATKSSYCDFGASFNCDMVNRSIYSVVLGVPVALIGVLGYITLFLLSAIYRSKAETPAMLLIAALAGLGFALYLTYLEKFVLVVWCILCLSSLGVILFIAVLASLSVVHSMRKA